VLKCEIEMGSFHLEFYELLKSIIITKPGEKKVTLKDPFKKMTFEKSVDKKKGLQEDEDEDKDGEEEIEN
jgi:hypothetical protein